ncbi:MAG TPA: lysophospholipid acyltransferase family protein [Thermoanaerobaculia bacterium]
MRRLITAFLRACLQIFYRRIELMGLERVPDRGPVIFAVNHPNGLVDPLFVLCFAARRVSFLGKAPLLEMPVVGWIVRLFDTIPVYRKIDGTSGSNQQTFRRAHEILMKGGGIAIFPEGTTHDDPSLRALKSGAARIALGASLEGIVIIPTGIYYTAKHVFRSAALVVFGNPLHVSPVPVDGDGEPPRAAVESLTAAIDEGLDAVTLQADSHSALELIARAEDAYTGDGQQPLVEELDLRRQFIAGYHYLREHDPERLARLESMVRQFEAELQRAGLEVHELTPRVNTLRLLQLVILLPIALAGVALNYPTYRFVGWLAGRLAKGESAVLATIKVLAALTLFPLTWAVIALGAGWWFGLPYGVAAITGMPLLGYSALRLVEETDDLIGQLRAVAHGIFRRYGHASLLAQHEAIRAELLRVAREMRR